jgi:hypothetical protein
MKAHPPQIMDWKSELLPWVEGQLRLELCLRTPELKNRGTLNEDLIWDFMSRIEVGVMKVSNSDLKTVKLSRSVQLTLSSWMYGVDVRYTLSRRTFYDHRRHILDQLGLDISLTYQKETAEREVFDLEYLKAHEIKVLPSSLQGFLFQPEDSPSWAM